MNLEEFMTATEPPAEEAAPAKETFTFEEFMGPPAPAPVDPLQYETKLLPEEEPQFEAWKATHAPKDSGEDYDLRGAFKAGLQPGPDGHWADTFKKPNHPTFSNQSQYAKDRPDLAGTWDGDTFVPAKGAPPAEPPGYISRSFQSFVSGLASVAENVLTLPAMASNIPATPVNALARMTGWTIGKGAPEWMLNNPISRYFSEASEAFNYRKKTYPNDDLPSLMEKKEFDKAGDYLAQSVIENAPMMIAQLGGSLAGVPQWKMLSALGATQAAQTYAQARDKQLTELEAVTAGIINGSLEAVFEKFGTSRLLTWGEELFKDVGKQTGKAILKNTLKLTLGSFFGEGFDEGFTQLTQDLTNKIYGIEDIPWKDFPRRAVEAATVGAVAGATMTAPAGALKGIRASDPANVDAARAEAIQQVLADHAKTSSGATETTQEGAGAAQNAESSTEPFDRFYAPNTNLEGTEATEQEAGATYARENLEPLLQAYEKTHGSYVSTDDFRDLLKPAGYTGTNSNAFHEPARALREEYFARRLAAAKAAGLDEVLVMAGGSASGKTSFLSKLEDAEQYGVVLDATLANPKSAQKLLKSISDQAFKARIVYVFRDPVEAARSAISRTARTGRIVNATEHVNMHEGSRNTVVSLIENPIPGVEVDLVTTNGKGGFRPATLEEIKAKSYTGTEVKVKDEYQKALNEGRLTPEQFQAAVGPQSNQQNQLPEADPAAGRSGPQGDAETPQQARAAGPEALLDPVSRDSRWKKHYEDNRARAARGAANRISEQISEAIDDGKKAADRTLGVISTRLKQINPAIKQGLRRFEFRTRIQTAKDLAAVEEMIRGSMAMSPQDNADFDLARKNGDVEVINGLARKYDINLDSVRATLDGIHKRAKEVGFDVGYLRDYHPRVVQNAEGLLDYFNRDAARRSLLMQAVMAKEQELHRILTSDEKIALINTLIRGMGQGRIKLSGTPNMKDREIDVLTPAMNAFYYDSDQALLHYIRQVNEAIEGRRFFGKGNKDLQFANVDESIGAYTMDLIEKGRIDPTDELELSAILKARFNYRGTSGVWGLFKNLAYIDTLGSPISAITQIEDIGTVLYRAPLEAPRSIIRAILNKSNITMKDIGIDTIYEELREGRKSAEALRKIFRVIGFEKLDRIGKESYVNSVIDKYRRQAKAPTPEFIDRLRESFGDSYQSVVSDLAAGKLTEEVQLLAFNELLEVQPVALSEVPQAYLESPNGRVFYMLKTFMIKRLDFLRNEIIAEGAREGAEHKIRAVKRALQFWGLAGAFGAGVDELKDFLLNRETTMSDRLVDNILKPFGLSKFFIYKARQDGFGRAAAQMILPPTRLPDSLYKDLVRIDLKKMGLNMIQGNLWRGKPLEITQSIPIGGKLWYWWVGGGAAKTRRKRGEGGTAL